MGYLSRNEEILNAILNNDEYTKVPQSREEALLIELLENGGIGSGEGTTNYNRLTNIPTINGVPLKGNLTTEDLGIESMSDDEVSDLWKDPGVLVLSDTSVNFTSVGQTKTFTVVEATGTVTVKSGDVNVARVSISGNTITVTAVGTGNTEITVTSGRTTNNRPEETEITVTCSF